MGKNTHFSIQHIIQQIPALHRRRHGPLKCLYQHPDKKDMRIYRDQPEQTYLYQAHSVYKRCHIPDREKIIGKVEQQRF